MPGCEHVCCEACAVNYFTTTVRDRPLVDATCPFCQEPRELGVNEGVAAKYFEELTPILEKLLAPQFYELFLKKLKEHALMKDPNFQWCHKVSRRVDNCLMRNVKSLTPTQTSFSVPFRLHRKFQV